MIYSLGHVSSAHFNPAVTVGFAAARRFPARMVGPYIASQILGAILAAGLLGLLLPRTGLQEHRFGATMPAVSFGSAFGIEVVLTFFLMLVIISVATDERVPPLAAGIAIGLTVMLAGLMAGPLTGSSMNPARSLAPAIMSGSESLAPLWIYIAGPVLGATLGAAAYEYLRTTRKLRPSCPVSCCPDEG
jgi:MIP family channel proteins